MLVRNITGGTINYAFASLTLAAGETAEIDNSFRENLDFQIAVTNQTIAVIEYEEDSTVYQTRITISQSPNQPSNEQKGALVASTEPSALNPYITHKNTDYNDLLVQYNSTTIIDIVPVNEKRITVGYVISVDSTIQYDLTSGKVIDASGNDTLTVPQASTLYFMYIANNTSTLGEKTVALSTTPPASNNYLTNSRRWKLIGYVATNTLTQVENKFCIASEANEWYNYLFIDNLTGSQASVSAATYEDIVGTETRVMLPKGWRIEISAILSAQTTVVPEVLEYTINDQTVVPSLPNWAVEATSPATNYFASCISYEMATSIQSKTYSAKVKGPATNHSIQRDTIKVLYKRSR